MANWLMKSEPETFSIDDLKACKNGTEPWDGVRNYQARNFMRDEMRVGDRVLFYHSNCKVPGVVGLAKVASKPYADPTQFNAKSKYYDADSDPNDPRWMLVDVKYVRHLKRTISLNDIKARSAALGDFALIRKGNRLSIMPVSDAQWDTLLSMEHDAS